MSAGTVGMLAAHVAGLRNVADAGGPILSASACTNLAKDLDMARAAIEQLIEDGHSALRILADEGREDSPLAGFIRASLARVGGAE